MTQGRLLCLTSLWETREVRLVVLFLQMLSTGFVVTVDMKPDGAIKINNSPLKILYYTSPMRKQILKCNHQDCRVSMISYS